MPGGIQQPPIIISGMHRSGTSLVASLLAELSVKLGDHLFPADAHNQPGYFEDLDFLRFHQHVLSQSFIPDDPGHLDWGWPESERLDVSQFERFRDQAQSLLAARMNGNDRWGWKDPRTTLFLDFWDSLLEEARYVFVYRFPWDVADSMQRLESKVFLSNPDYAYRIWAFYNKRLVDFYRKHSDRCVLVSINALRENLEKFVSLLGDKLGLATRDAGLEEVFKDHLFSSIEGPDPLIDLVAAAWPDCARLLSELDELADISGAHKWQARPITTRLSRPDAKDNDQVDLSVVTPCHEQGTLLLEAVASVERHAPPRCELIIVNDGSRQAKTLEILDLLKRSGYFVIDQENIGLSGARNKAIGLARGRYILPLDDDNRIREGFLDAAIDVLDSKPEVGVVYGDRFDFGLRTRVHRVPEFELVGLLEFNPIDACAVFRKQLWIDADGYDPLMNPADDWELWVGAAARGWLFHHLHRVTFDYRIRPGSLISRLTTAKMDELRQRLRVKHPELYLAEATKDLRTVTLQLANQTYEYNRLDAELHLLESQLATLSSDLDAQRTRVETLELTLAEQAEKNQSQLAMLSLDLDAQRTRAETVELMLAEQAEKYQQMIRARDEDLASLRDTLADTQRDNTLLVAQLGVKTEELERVTNSTGWRMLTHYGRIKYRYLLPLYRLFR